MNIGNSTEFTRAYLGRMCVALTPPPFIAVVAWGLSKLRRTRSVLWVMDVYPEVAVAYGVLRHKSLLYRVFIRLNRVLHRNATAVIALGEVMSQRLEAAGVPGDRLFTVHNWTPGEAMAAVEEEPLALNS